VVDGDKRVVDSDERAGGRNPWTTRRTTGGGVVEERWTTPSISAVAHSASPRPHLRRARLGTIDRDP
jgi:hypothetical protein